MNPTLKNLLRVLAVVLVVHLALALFVPRWVGPSLRGWARGMGDVMAIVPSVLILIGLFEAWVPKEVVARHLGRRSGVRGILLALLLGTGAAGPIYAAFPIGVTLLEKGARLANLVIFLGAWATIKLPMLLMESAFLGTRFAMLRLVLTLPGLIACGFLVEFLMPGRAVEPSPSPGD
jgi:uncharacterized membrane protein YraQ (UPF0718 family)